MLQQQLQVEEASPDHQQAPDQFFPPNSPVSHLSSTDALAELIKFRNSPFFAYYAGRAQFECDEATRKVFLPLSHEDPYAVQHREQLIGEAPAYLFFKSLSDADLLGLQELVKKQTND